MKIEGVVTANGTEQFITIGQFKHWDSTRHILLVDSSLYDTIGNNISLYLVDDVSVIDCDNIPFAGHDTVLMHVGDSAFIGPHEVALPYTWFVLGSTTPIDSGGGIWVHPTTTTTYVLQQKLCGQDKLDTVTVHVWPDTTLATSPRPSPKEREVVLWPNPVGGLLAVEHVEGVTVTLCNLLGTTIAERRAGSGERSITFDMSQLPTGVYLVIATDENGVKQVRKTVKN
jgi:hypothetical protein